MGVGVEVLERIISRALDPAPSFEWLGNPGAGCTKGEYHYPLDSDFFKLFKLVQ